MDADYLAFSILLVMFGVVGVTATAGVSPDILTSATCNCIPSSLARFQELALIALAFGLGIAPVAVVRSGSSGATPPIPGPLPSGRTYTPTSMRSGGLFVLGLSLVILGVGLVAVPALLVLHNLLMLTEGAMMVVVGIALARRGSRPS